MYHVIEGFEKLSKQEMFNISLAHVRKNGRPSVKPRDPPYGFGTICVYGGIGCAAAPFLTEEGKEHGDDGLGSWNELVFQGIVPEYNDYFVRLLQEAHDKSIRSQGDEVFMKEYEERMRQLAAIEGLTYEA